MNIDCAFLVFCRGKQLQAGDDRKVVAPGLFVDKHVTTPGKDADDSHQDGRGAMGRDNGERVVEWAIPLDSGDSNDIQVKPGGDLRWNLAYFDAFRADLTGTTFGVAGGDLNDASTWGTLHLASDVQDDGDSAFQGPAWIRAALEHLTGPVATRLQVTDTTFVPGVAEPMGKALIQYNYLDTQGKETIGKAKVYLPPAVRDGKKRVPLYYSAGYELDDRSAAAQLLRGFAVVTPRDLKANPLVQTPNPDVALLHIARSLPFIDDTRVVIGGGSAGGYMTLMLAAETFPLAGAAADVPPMNWGYNAAYFLQTKNWKTTDEATDAATEQPPALPVFSAVATIAQQALAVYGHNTDEPIWYRHSPLSQLDTITCPVITFWSTADMLVPINQVDSKWIRPFDPQAYPAGFTMDPAQLCATPQGRQTLLDLLPKEEYELFVLPEDQIKERLSAKNGAAQTAELPLSRTKRWSITILDEGCPEPQLGHMKYAVPWSRNNFIDFVATGNIAPTQLTLPKLQRLMDRYAGKEWLPTRLKHLDVTESEQADVIRGLQTYVAGGTENAATLRRLYGQLSAARQVLAPDIVATLRIESDKDPSDSSPPKQERGARGEEESAAAPEPLIGAQADSETRPDVKAQPDSLQAACAARWPSAKAWKWYRQLGPVAGCNYLPRTAVNTTEMWQQETFDPQTIDQELGWAHEAGYNSVRVFLQYVVWKEDPDGFKRRLGEFLTIAQKHNIRVMLVPFCDCAFAGREPYLGPQDAPVPGVHNSGWVPSPGLKRVVDRTAWPDLEKYIKDLIGHFGHDQRVLIWDLYNEPGNSNLWDKSLPLVVATFHWARATAPNNR